MKNFQVWLTVAVVLAALMLGGKAMGQGSPAPDEAAQMVSFMDAHPERVFSLADTLKAHPYGPDSMTILSLMTQYGLASRKVELRLGSIMSPIATSGHQDIELRLFGQYVTGLIVYALEHDGKAGATQDSIAFGLQDVLVAYHTMLRERPNDHNAYADKLLALKHSGKLSERIREAMAVDRADEQAHQASPSPSSAPTGPAASPASPNPETPPEKG